MRKLSILLLSMLFALCISACGGGDSKDTSGVGKSSVSTENVGETESVEETEDGENQESETEKKPPVPSEEYVLYKEFYKRSENYYIYEYNEKGHVVKKTLYYTDIEPAVSTYEYVYNTDGSYTVTGGGQSKEYFEYDAKGRCVLKKDSQTTTTNIYDDMDRLIESKTLGTINNVRSWTKMTYDGNGLLIKTQFYYEDGTPANWYEYDYDENGRQILRHDYNTDGVEEYENITFEWIFEYDEYGRVTLEAKKDAERGGTSEEYLYEYDEAGGICKKTDTRWKTVYEYKPLSQCISK